MAALRGRVEKQQPCKTGLGSGAVRSSPRTSVSSVGGCSGSGGDTCDAASLCERNSSDGTGGTHSDGLLWAARLHQMAEDKCALYLRPLATRQSLGYRHFALLALSFFTSTHSGYV